MAIRGVEVELFRVPECLERREQPALKAA